MQAIGFSQPLPIEHEQSLVDIELPMPILNPNDILVEIQAISVNPADVKVRASHTPQVGQYRILGWDAAGVVKEVGSKVKNFRVGDEVYYAGVINRQGSYAQYQAVDERIVAHKPKSLSFAQAAALPLTALTAWETLFDRLQVNTTITGGNNSLLLIGGAGGVGSMTIQLAKTLTDLTVIATASRDESKNWVKQLGADYVVNHHNSLAEQFTKQAIVSPEFVFSTNSTDKYLKDIVALIMPQGKIALIDDPEVLDVNPLKGKSLSLHWEFMFTRPMFATADIQRQSEILSQVAKLVDEKKLITTMTTNLKGINAKNLKQAHAMLELGKTIGKIVLEK